jgi:hypothetical protein
MKTEIDVIRDVSHRLERAKIPYMLTGSMAMNYYAEPRMTRDIDVVLALRPQDTALIMTTFTPDYYVSEKAVGDSIAHESIFNLIHQESVIKVDCIARKNTEYRKLEFDRRKQIKIQDFNTYIVSKEDLIISKLLWAKDSCSELQLRDVGKLLATGYDKAYLAQWTKKLGVDTLLEEHSHE